MSEQQQAEETQSGRGTPKNPSPGEREAQLDAAIEASFPASDPVASFDFR